MRRLISAVAAGYAGFGLAVGIGIPVWDWRTGFGAPDGIDIATVIFLAVFLFPKSASLNNPRDVRG